MCKQKKKLMFNPTQPFEEALKNYDVDTIIANPSKISPLPNDLSKRSFEKRQTYFADQVKFDKEDIVALTKIIIDGHPGYPDFPASIKSKFEQGMKNLYNSFTSVTIQDVWDIVQLLPDNHLKLMVYRTATQEQPLRYHTSDRETKVGNNLLSKKDFGDIEIKGKTAIIKMPDTGNIANIEKVYEFLNKFDRFVIENQDAFDNIIIDIRDNPGGSSVIHNYVARALSGNEVGRGGCEVMRSTKENAYIMYKMNEISLKTYKQFPTRNQTETIIDERGYAALYPAFKKGGINKPIFILQNCNTGSAGEAFIEMFKNHPSAITIGENSCGVIEYRSSKSIYLKNGLGIRIAGTKYDFTDENPHRLKVEQFGFSPDIPIEDNAFNWTQSHIDSTKVKKAFEHKKKMVEKRAFLEKNIINTSETRIAVVRELMQLAQKMDPEAHFRFFCRLCPDRRDDYPRYMEKYKDYFSKQSVKIHEKNDTLSDLLKTISQRDKNYNISPSTLNIPADSQSMQNLPGNTNIHLAVLKKTGERH